ncbi:MAG: hypothetical protein ACQEWF_22445 [Bacillota bacterium]
MISCFDDEALARQYVERLNESYPRYRRDQYQMLLDFSQVNDREEITLTLGYCVDMDLYSANEFKNAHNYLYHVPMVVEEEPFENYPVSAETERKLALIQTEKRSLETYNRMMGVS